MASQSTMDKLHDMRLSVMAGPIATKKSFPRHQD